MKAGFFYSLERRQVYYRIKRQVILDYQLELEQATGIKRSWIRWKRRLTLENRYNQILFSEKQPHRSSTQYQIVQ